MAIPIVLACFVSDYSSLSQHLSELELGPAWIAWAIRITAVVSGISIVLFALGCLLLHGCFRFSWTFLAALLFGLAMMANGIFIVGNPLHGLYGLAIFLVLVPAFFVAEFPNTTSSNWFRDFSLMTATLGLIYMWILLAGLDPIEYRGLTQRVATVLAFSWFGVAVFCMREFLSTGLEGSKGDGI